MVRRPAISLAGYLAGTSLIFSYYSWAWRVSGYTMIGNGLDKDHLSLVSISPGSHQYLLEASSHNSYTVDDVRIRPQLKVCHGEREKN